MLQGRGRLRRHYAGILGITALWLVALALIVRSSIDRLSVPPWGNPMGDRLSPEVAGDTYVGQLFTAPMPGLYRIEIALARSTAHSNAHITVHLKSEPASAEDLWTANLDTQDVYDGMLYGFEFAPIRGSQGQTYYFYFESDESVPGDAIAVRYSPHAALEGATTYLNGQPAAGNLQFHSFYSLRTRDRVNLLLARMADGRPYMFGTPGFYLGLAVAYALVLGTFLWLVIRAVLRTPEERA